MIGYIFLFNIIESIPIREDIERTTKSVIRIYKYKCKQTVPGTTSSLKAYLLTPLP